MQIRITDQHVYLDEHDIGPFVASGSIQVRGDRVVVELMGEVVDERAKEAPKPKRKVSDGDR